jgi:cysteine desulfurase
LRYYFDHNSCTPVDPRVLDRFREIEEKVPGNPGSLHATGRRAGGVVEDARYQVATALDVDPDHVVFVSGGTEANNIAILGSGDPELPVLCAAVEHPSVLQSAEQRGVAWWKVDANGIAIITRPTVAIGMIALTHGQNEVGSVQPVAAAAELARRLGVPLHIDASQTLGRCSVAAVVAAASSITFSTHKASGLRGMAILIDKNIDTRPRFFGGGQQRDRRPGTESPSLVAATALALELAITEQEERAAKMREARDAFANELEGGDIRSLTPTHSLPNTIMFQFDGIDGRELLPALDMAGVEASQGSACSSGSPTPPLVLTAMGLSDRVARTCVRFSFSFRTTRETASDGGRVVKSVVRGMKSHRGHA